MTGKRRDWTEARALVAQGLTASEISRALCIPKPTVSEWIRREALPAMKASDKPPKQRMTREALTPERVRELLDYDPETGRLTHRENRGSRRVGEEAGTVNHHGGGVYKCRELVIERMRVGAHRAAWAHFHGVWPQGEIDHINGDALDNRIANLRDVPRRVNAQNKRRQITGAQTGLLGVTVHNNCHKRFRARISVGKTTWRLGYFATAEEAHAAYVEAKRRLHEGCTL